jgi:hypothetical protein
MLLFITAVMTALHIIFFNRYTALFIATMVLTTAFLLVYTLWGDPALYGAVNGFVEISRETFQYINGYLPPQPLYEMIISYGACVAVSLFFFGLSSGRHGFLFLAALAAGIYGIALSNGGMVSGLAFTACVSALMLMMGQSMHKNPSYKIAAVTMVCLLFAYCIPSPRPGFANAITDDLVNKPINYIERVIARIFHPKHFNMRTTGFMPNGERMGGDISPNDEPILEVVTSIPNLYLAGAYKNHYTGFSWVNTLNEADFFPNDGMTVEFLEKMFGNILLSLEYGEFPYLAQILSEPETFPYSHYANRTAYIDGGTMTIQMQQNTYPRNDTVITKVNNKMYTVFKPRATTGVYMEGNTLSILSDNGGNLTASSIIGAKEPYTVQYRGNTTTWAHNQIMMISRRGIYNKIYEALNSLRDDFHFDKRQLSALLDQSLDEEPHNMHMFKMYPPNEPFFDPEISIAYEYFLADVLIPRAEFIYDYYTRLPEDLPKRVVDLAIDITERYNSTIEKVLYLMMFMANYPYTHTPGDTPEDRDFVDYFLFDQLEGYCVHFASALAILCRAVGIPARYVEGFVLPDENEGGRYIVTNSQAHAWVEVYLEGYGWHRYDPVFVPRTDISFFPLINIDDVVAS